MFVNVLMKLDNDTCGRLIPVVTPLRLRSCMASVLCCRKSMIFIADGVRGKTIIDPHESVLHVNGVLWAINK